MKKHQWYGLATKNSILRIVSISILFSSVIPQTTLASLLAFQGQYQSELEELAAISNQAVYDQLLAGGCGDADTVASANCSGTTFVVWNNVRELVHTANALNNSGSTIFSLDSDLEGLGFALRWTAGEEFSSEESLVDSFLSSQLSGLASRITALRGGASGFNVAGVATDANGNIAHLGNIKNSPQYTGMNSGDEMADVWSRLGGFLNATYTTGDQDASEREDAFDFVGVGFNAGLDYRLDDYWVVGGLLGYIAEEVDFDSGKSIVDGGVIMYGYSMIGFALYQSDTWFYSGSIGYQLSDFETKRSIRYPSINPDVANVDTSAESNNDAYTYSYSLATGIALFVSDTFTLEPSFSASYQEVTIDEYREQDIHNAGFDFFIDKQNIASLETATGLKAQFTLSTRYGVFMPFADIQFFTQHKTGGHSIRAAYVGASQTLTDDAFFNLPTNNVDANYETYSIGMAAVVRGAAQSYSGAPASGGVQVYFNYREVHHIGDYHQKSLSGGMRYEF
ncbi:MAG: hypothetical protein COA99_05465 [Moraxellaceae bacterium]|nr:MAG: hypothetical protein COA99_05465 [Moraxellaceae bacterium]